MRQRQYLFGWIVLVGLVCHVGQCLDITLIHTNDVHSRFEETDQNGGECTPQKRITPGCYGGFGRLIPVGREIQRTHPNVVYLSGGDYFQGTVWYTIFKWEVVAHFINQLNHTAMALGNHEFDDGVDGLVPLANNVTFPLLSANLNISLVPQLAGKIKKSIIREYEGQKIGIIGYTTEETPLISNPGKLLTFGNITEAVTLEAKRLTEQEGIKIIIAVGHAGIIVDEEVAKIPYVDVVVGGHTNTFLYNGSQPDHEIPESDYPHVVSKPDGTLVPVVQAYAFGKYMGLLNLTFDTEGNLTRWSGNPILLNNQIVQDDAVLTDLSVWRERVIQKTKVEIGRIRVPLDGNRFHCRKGECNLGNLIADAQVYHYQKFANTDGWSEITLGIVHSGSIRKSITVAEKNGSVSMEDILAIQPYGHNVDWMLIKGKHLREVFEYAIADFDPNFDDPSGKFLQVSGIRIVFDVTKPNGQRVKSIQILCQDCDIPRYGSLVDDKIYKVTVPGFLVNGGGGFEVLKRHVIEHFTSGVTDSDVLIGYFASNRPVIQGVEERIAFESEHEIVKSCKTLLGLDQANTTTSNPIAIPKYTVTLSILPPINVTHEIPIQAEQGTTEQPDTKLNELDSLQLEP